MTRKIVNILMIALMLSSVGNVFAIVVSALVSLPY